MNLRDARLHAVVSPSWRLRDELLAEVLAPWDGPIKRSTEPKDLDSLVLGLDTPSLFEEPACCLLSAGDKYLTRHRELLLPLVGAPVVAGLVVLVVERLPRNEALGKRLAGAGQLYEAAAPSGRELEGWLIQRLTDLPQGVEQPRAVADALIGHRGDDIDGLLAAFGQAADYAGEAPVTVAAIHAVVGGDAEAPVWAFTDAVLGGQAAKAVRQFHAGSGLDPHQALAALVAEIRKSLCCLASEDDAEAGALAGMRGRPRLYHARRRARELGRRCLQRLLTGALQAQRDLRKGGVDAELTIETLVLNIQRVIRMGEGPRNATSRSRSRA
jgi:DNA polymerase III delta subunit